MGLAARLISDLLRNPGETSKAVLAEAANKLATATLYVAVVGDFKRGKSSLINALLGVRLLPVGVVPLTAQPTLIRWGAEPRLLVTRTGGTEVVAVDRLGDFVTESGNPGNRRKVREVWVEYPSPLLGEGMVLVDTPGTGSLHEHNTAAARAFLPRIDVALGVLTAESPLSLSEASWLREVAARAARIVICLNKVDALSAEEQAEALEYVRVGVEDVLGAPPPPIYSVSARRELDAGGDDGVASLRCWLSDELQKSRLSISWDSAARAGGAALELARSALALERAALATPVRDAHDGQRRVLAAQDRLLKVAAEGRVLLAAQASDLIRSKVEPQLDGTRSDARQRLLALSGEPDWQGELQTMAHESVLLLQDLVKEPLHRGLADQAERLQGVLDQLLDQVTASYLVTLPSAPRLADPARLANFRVSSSEEMGALAMGLRSARRALPGSLGRSWRERARQRDAEEAADRLAGRLRSATVAAIEVTVREWLAWSDAEWRRRGAPVWTARPWC